VESPRKANRLTPHNPPSIAIRAIVCDHLGMTTKRTASKAAAAPSEDETEGERLDREALEHLKAAVEARDQAEDAVTTAVAECRNRPPHAGRRAPGIVWDAIAEVLGMHQPNAVRKYNALLNVQQTVRVTVRKPAPSRKRVATAGRRQTGS